MRRKTGSSPATTADPIDKISFPAVVKARDYSLPCLASNSEVIPLYVGVMCIE